MKVHLNGAEGASASRDRTITAERVPTTPVTKLSELIANLNDRFGMNLGGADIIWVQQSQQVVMDDAELARRAAQ